MHVPKCSSIKWASKCSEKKYFFLNIYNLGTVNPTEVRRISKWPQEQGLFYYWCGICASMRIWCASMRISKNRRMASPITDPNAFEDFLSLYMPNNLSYIPKEHMTTLPWHTRRTAHEDWGCLNESPSRAGRDRSRCFAPFENFQWNHYKRISVAPNCNV